MCGILRNFQLKNMLAIKVETDLERICYKQNASKGANRSEKIVLNLSKMKRKNRAV